MTVTNGEDNGRALPTGAVLIVGVGSGLGAALARRFAAGGAPVALGARSTKVTKPLAEEINADGGTAMHVAYDATDEQQVDQAIREVEDEFGQTGTLIYNAGNMVRGGVEDISASDFTGSWKVNALGAFLHAQRLAAGMVERGEGAMLFTGATSSVRAPAHSVAFGPAKFALRGLAMALNRSLGPQGVHVGHVLLDGVIRTPRSKAYLDDDEPALEPDDIANVYWNMANQPHPVWSFEIDLRPRGDDYLIN